MRQPTLGIAATAIVIAISLGYIALWDFGTFIGWVSFFALSFIPFEVMTGVLWGGSPPFVAGLQPAGERRCAARRGHAAGRGW